MRTENLVVFLSVAKFRSISEAARCEHLTQPAVTNIINQLEKQYRVRLFDRTPRQKKPLELTPKGKILYDYAIELLSLTSKLEHELTLDDTEPAITLGSGKSNCIYLLPKIIKSFKTAYPDVECTVSSYPDSFAMLDQILSSNCDLGIAVNVPELKNFVSKKFLADPYRLAVPRSLNVPSSIPPEELLKLPIVMREKGCYSYIAIETALEKIGISIKDLDVVMTTYDNAALFHAVSSGVGCGFLMDSILKSDGNIPSSLKQVHIRKFKADRQLYICHRKNANLSPNQKLLWDFVLTGGWNLK